MLKEKWHRPPGHAVTRVDRHFERPDLAGVDDGEGMLDVGGEHFFWNQIAPPAALRLGEVAGQRDVANLGEAVVERDGPGFLAADLKAVVLRWIVRGGDHDPG